MSSARSLECSYGCASLFLGVLEQLFHSSHADLNLLQASQHRYVLEVEGQDWWRHIAEGLWWSISDFFTFLAGCLNAHVNQGAAAALSEKSKEYFEVPKTQSHQSHRSRTEKKPEHVRCADLRQDIDRNQARNNSHFTLHPNRSEMNINLGHNSYVRSAVWHGQLAIKNRIEIAFLGEILQNLIECQVIRKGKRSRQHQRITNRIEGLTHLPRCR